MRSKILSAEKFKKLSLFWQENAHLCVNTAFLILGTVLGSAMLRTNTSSTASIFAMAEKYTGSLKEANLFTMLWQNFAVLLPYIIVLFILGFCSFGFFTVQAVALFRGVGLGAALGSLCINNSFKGIAFGSLVLIPPAVISSAAFIVGCTAACRLSLLQAKLFKRGTRCLSMRLQLIDYCRLFSKLLAAVAASALLGTVLSVLWSYIFEF
ncbi:MAG: hypothetical protein IJL87_09315 [Clostridia bacterium]|nr:hypothetical protein [Clostridia bacterium]